jgi:hypothetical protein
MTLAAAAAVALLARPAVDEGGTRVKGSAHVAYHVKRGDRVFRGSTEQPLHPGDLLRFTATTDRARHLAIFSLDAHGTATVYYAPRLATDVVGPGTDLPLETSVELDDSMGEERLFALFCDEPIGVESVREGLAQARSIVPRPGCTVNVVRVSKEPPP